MNEPVRRGTGVPIFALEDALERVDQDRELLKELIDIFFREYERNILELRGALLVNNNTLVRRAAHSIKGAAANIGAMQVSENAAKIESLDPDTSRPEVEEAVALLANTVAIFRKEHVSFLSGHSNTH